MNTSKLIHKTLENVNWDYVTRSFRGLGLQWYGSEKIPTKKELVTDLTEIIEAACEKLDTNSLTSQIVTPYWIVVAEQDEESKEVLLEVIFTPFVVLTSSEKENNQTTEMNREKLNNRLNIAVDKENYELATSIRGILDTYNKTN